MLLPSTLKAEEKSDPRGLLVAAKFAGWCGSVHQMIQLQESTKMDGGYEFIHRYLSVEAARLGYKSSKDLVGMCGKSIELYDTMYKELGK